MADAHLECGLLHFSEVFHLMYKVQRPITLIGQMGAYRLILVGYKTDRQTDRQIHLFDQNIHN